MIAKTSKLNLHDPFADSDATIQDKETQTSKTSIELMSSDQTSSKPIPTENKNKDEACKDDNIKVFEFCELVKDPQDDSISIVKETFTEEVINSPEGSVFGKPTHNRYKYSREVITPYCKSHTTACPKYMPTHREIPFKKSLSNTSKDSNSSNKLVSSTGGIIMTPNKKKTTFENPSNTSIKKEEKRGKVCNPTYPKNETKQCQKEATNCEPYSKCAQYKDETKLKEYLSSCLSTTVTIAKKASAACIDKCEKTIGILPPKCGEEKPTYYVLKKPKSKDSINDKSSYDTVFDSDVVQNVTSGVKSVIDSVVNTTKETVKMFTNSSCKDLQRDKDSKTKDCESKSVTKVASILPNEFKNHDVKEGTTENTGLKKLKTVLSHTFKRENSTNRNETTAPKSQENSNSNGNSISLTKITSIFTSKESKAESSEKSSLTKIKDIFNPFQSKEENFEANKSSLTKLTDIFTDRFKSKDDTDSKTKKSLTRIKSVISDSFKRDDSPETSVKDSASLEKVVEPAVAAIERITSAVISVRGMSMTDLINSRLDRSSPEDNPNIIRKAPQPTYISHESETTLNRSHNRELPMNISHEREVPTNISHEREDETNENPSMFTMIKSKFLSMFADSKEDVEESEENDEEEAEKMYSKFSDH